MINVKNQKITHQIAMANQQQYIQSAANALSRGAVPIGLVISEDGKTAYVANTNVAKIFLKRSE